MNRRSNSAQLIFGTAIIALCSALPAAAVNLEILTAPSKAPDCVTIAGPSGENAATIVVDTSDYAVVQLAANFFADDVRRVTGRRLLVTNSTAGAPQMIIAGTLGHSAFIDGLAAGGKLHDLDKIRGHWEATLWEVVQNPFPGVERALVIVGSDRRGTAYGLMQLSEKIGVSPWYWWADVPPKHHDAIAVKISAPQTDAPGVKYRGFFINDEDWGLNPWASKTFDPKFGNIGPKTYEKVFELMLRLRLNYLWPAMHACSTEFGSVPENAALAHKFGIVAGSSHCEPMLFNNVHWNERTQGRWNYSLNRDAIYGIWEETAKTRGEYEAVWTLGIRGIHDRAMETPPNDMPGKINLMGEVFHDQRGLLDQYVTKQWGPIAQCFVPYKEVLPIYDAGLKVPDDVTLVWVDDNFGYIRRLSDPAERQRPGGAGVYWHMSYYGSPHSYTWINTTAPALTWEELHKAWQNDARTLWVINVGDIKPGEIGIDYFSRLAWNPDGFSRGGQREFLHDFAARNFGQKFAQPLTDLLMEYYHLGTIRKPELMDRNWALSLTPDRAKQLERDYQDLLKREKSISAAVPADARDAYTEMVGFPARILAETGLIFMADREIQETNDVMANSNEIGQLRNDLEARVENYNTKIAGGKWNHIMPGLVTGKNLMAWGSQVRWPWGEATNRPAVPREPAVERVWRDAATADHFSDDENARWAIINGLGPSGRDVALEPANLESSWAAGDTNAPSLEYRFRSKGGNAEALIDFLPTFRIYPGMKLRVSVSVDNQPATLVEVPGSSGAENENGAIRNAAVQDNYVRAQIPLPNLAAGRHTLAIRAVDPGVVIDSVSLP
jgi:Glycosyl hydrolase family 115/Gylcosyl hydrolase family 115 C-terminal domain